MVTDDAGESWRNSTDGRRPRVVLRGPTHPGKLTAQLAHLHTVANSGSDAGPTQPSIERIADLDRQLADVYSRLDEVLGDHIDAFSQLVGGIELPAVVVPE